MQDEVKTETMELVVTACEKHSNNNEVRWVPCVCKTVLKNSTYFKAAAKMIKEEMDKKLGPPFHVVVGEGFGFEISYECSNLLYMFFGGNLAICIWKC